MSIAAKVNRAISRLLSTLTQYNGRDALLVPASDTPRLTAIAAHRRLSPGDTSGCGVAIFHPYLDAILMDPVRDGQMLRNIQPLEGNTILH